MWGATISLLHDARPSETLFCFEMRSNGWNWPGVGLLMCYDDGMLKMLQATVRKMAYGAGKGCKVEYAVRIRGVQWTLLHKYVGN